VQALKETAVAGPVTNQSFLAALLSDGDVRAGRMDTGLIGRDIERFSARPDLANAVALGVATLLQNVGDDAEELTFPDRATPWGARDGFQLGAPRVERRRLTVNGVLAEFEVEWDAQGPIVTGGNGASDIAAYSEHRPGPGAQTDLSLPVYDAGSVSDGNTGDTVRAPINGKVARVFVSEGHVVAKGDRIAVVEAMKMEHVLHAVRDGTIAKVAVREGQQVTQGTLMVSLVEG
jgi:3-methylcrotonyl-CoA carboxylase alpha subunit